MTCRQASLLMATGAVDTAPRAVRATLRAHLVICRHCREFQRQLDALSAALRRLTGAGSAGDDVPADLTGKIVRRARL